MNNAAINICVQFLYRHILLLPLGMYLGVEFLDHVITPCLTFWGTADCLQGGCNIPHSHHHCMRVPVSLHPRQHLLLYVFLLIVLLFGLKWYLIVVVIFISLMTIGIKQLFMCLLTSHISSLEKCLFGSLAHF